MRLYSSLVLSGLLMTGVAVNTEAFESRSGDRLSSDSTIQMWEQDLAQMDDGCKKSGASRRCEDSLQMADASSAIADAGKTSAGIKRRGSGRRELDEPASGIKRRGSGRRETDDSVKSVADASYTMSDMGNSSDDTARRGSGRRDSDSSAIAVSV